MGSGAVAGNLIDNPSAFSLTVNDCLGAASKYARFTDFPTAGTVRFPSFGQLNTCRYNIPGLLVTRPNSGCVENGLAVVP